MGHKRLSSVSEIYSTRFADRPFCRLTAVFTPALASILGQEVVKREWIACGAALLGGILISLDTALSSDPAAADAALGNPLSLGGRFPFLERRLCKHGQAVLGPLAFYLYCPAHFLR
jgi:drug/metabolite transporter (DMT)-like permease